MSVGGCVTGLVLVSKATKQSQIESHHTTTTTITSTTNLHMTNDKRFLVLRLLCSLTEILLEGEW